MYGDSLTDGWSWSTSGLPAFEKYFGKYKVLNAGISGAPRRCEAMPDGIACKVSQLDFQQHACSALMGSFSCSFQAGS